MKNKSIYAIIGLIVVITIAVLAVHYFKGSHQAQNQGQNQTQNQTTAFSGPASLSLVSPTGSDVSQAALAIGTYEHVAWTSFNYSAPTVSVNIIRKVSDNPVQYELVRTVAVATKNDGDALWIPNPGDVGTNTYVQVGCAESAQACQASAIDTDAPLAVLDNGQYDNTASAYEASFEAIEALYNK